MLLKVVPEFDLGCFFASGSRAKQLKQLQPNRCFNPTERTMVLMLGEVPRRIKQSA